MSKKPLHLKFLPKLSVSILPIQQAPNRPAAKFKRANPRGKGGFALFLYVDDEGLGVTGRIVLAIDWSSASNSSKEIVL